MDANEIKVFSNDTIEFIEELIADRDRWKHMAEDNASGMVGLQDIVDKQNDVLGRVRVLRDNAVRDKCKIRRFDLTTALNCTVCGEEREQHNGN